MKIGFITDSTCDLPSPILTSNNLHILPTKLVLEQSEFLDDKTPEVTKNLLDLLNTKADFSINSLSPIEIKNFLIKTLENKDYEHLIFLMPTKSQNSSYDNTLEIISKTMVELRNLKTTKGLKATIQFELIDTQQISSGLGLMVAESLYKASKDIIFNDIISRINSLSQFTQTYIIPNTLTQLYHSSQSGTKKLGLTGYLIGNAFDLKPIIFNNKGNIETIAKIKGFEKAFSQVIDIVIEQIKNKNLITNHINMTYSGSLTNLSKNNKFQELENISKQNNILINFAKMSPTMIVNFGLDAFSVAFASNKIMQI